MIDRIVIENFKSLRRVDLALGRMNLFIGANASGKSSGTPLSCSMIVRENTRILPSGQPRSWRTHNG